MVARVVRFWRGLTGAPIAHVDARPGPEAKILALLAGLVALAASDAAFFQTVVASIGDAYVQVSVFVALTLGGFYILERYFDINTIALMTKYRRLQVPLAAFLGALPGCGGAVIIITQYVTGRVGFGSMVAVLIATMGDAAFLLLAREPLTALGIFALGLGVGTVFGYMIEAVHGPDFLRRPAAPFTGSPGDYDQQDSRSLHAYYVLKRMWLILLAPGAVCAVLVATQINTSGWHLAGYDPVAMVGFLGGMLCLFMWLAQPGSILSVDTQTDRLTGDRVVADTNFVTSWVIVGFLVYESLVHFAGLDLKSWFQTVAPLAPLIGVLVGFFPGCGPQVVVTTLYLNGVVPLSAQLGNAISNDGDALFPAIAMAPRAAIIATLYSGIPALLVGYGWFAFFEGGLL